MTSAHLLSRDMRLETFRVPCLVCKKMLAFTSVSRHMKTVHSEKIGKIWGCVECGKILQDEKRLTQHQTIHNPQSENPSFFVGPLSVRPRRGKILDFLLLLKIIALSSKSVQLITSDASQTHITIHFPKAGDTHNPLTHCPLPHHPHRPTLPTKSTHNSHNMAIFPFFGVLHYTMHIFSKSW